MSAPTTRHLHRKLRTTDAVVSLNYDCLMDRALANHAESSRFDPERGGYGVACDPSGVVHWRNSGRGKRPQGSILLLKLHGSLELERPDDPQSGCAPIRIKPWRTA